MSSTRPATTPPTPRSARFTIEVAKGFEYDVNKATVEVKAGENQTVTVRMKRMVDFHARGWRSGSNHVHMNYAGNLHNTPANMLLMAKAEDMNMTSLQIANKDNRVLDVQAYTPGQSLHPLSKDDYLMHVGQEYRPPFYGHISLFNLTEHLISPFVTGYEGTGIESLYPSNTDIFRYAKQQGGIGSYVHPYYADGDPLETNLGTAKGFPVDVALEALSYHELWSQSAGDAPLLVWYHALNNGFRVPVTGGEDSISSLHRVELVGVSRGYFQIGDQPFTWQSWMKALLAGRGFVTNGPLLEFNANGAGMGEEVTVPAGGGKVTFTGTLNSIVPVDRFELVSNGKVVHTIPLTGDKRRASFELPLEVKTSGWYSLRAIGAPLTFPTENTKPMAVTNPIYVVAGGSADPQPGVGRVLHEVDRQADGDGLGRQGLAQRQGEGPRARPVQGSPRHLRRARQGGRGRRPPVAGGGIALAPAPLPEGGSAVDQPEMERLIKNIDARLARVEQKLPTLATKDGLAGPSDTG